MMITVNLGRHGSHSVSTADVDRAIAKYLPASPNDLRAIVEERLGAEVDYSDVTDVSAFLLILADFDRTDGQ